MGGRCAQCPLGLVAGVIASIFICVITSVIASGCAGAKPVPCEGKGCRVSLEEGDKSNPSAPSLSDMLNTVDEKLRNDSPGDARSWREVGAPDWIATGGNSVSYPAENYLTGIAMARGEDGLKRAMTEAAADLANRISVRIEHELTDASSEKNGQVDYHIAAITRMTSDVRLSGLRYEVTHRDDKVYALAYVERTHAVAKQITLRDRAIDSLRECMASAKKRSRAGEDATAAMGYLRCLRYVADGLRHDAVVRIVDERSAKQVQKELVSSLQKIRDASSSLVSRPAASLQEAADFLAVQLAAASGLSGDFGDVAPFRYGTTNFSSPFGQQISLHLMSALGRHSGEMGGSVDTPNETGVIQGVYFQEGENLRLSATLRGLDTGALLGGAETLIAKSRVPHGIALFPKNLEQAMVDQRLLSEGELVDGKLRVEIWADKGRRGVVYTESEDIRIFIRVNAPAYVRLIYVLESGVQVPIDQAYYIDGSKVNMAVEYPDSFEVVPPFGIEHIHATAFTNRPAPLPIAKRVIDGIHYEVVSQGLSTVVRHRGIKRKKKDEVAESLLSISTLPRSNDTTY